MLHDVHNREDAEENSLDKTIGLEIGISVNRYNIEPRYHNRNENHPNSCHKLAFIIRETAFRDHPAKCDGTKDRH